MKRAGHVTLAMVGLLWLLGAGVRAEVPADDTGERETIRAARAAAEATYREQVLACSQVFAVTACTDKARATRHAVFTRLDQRLWALDEAARLQRAQERLQAIGSKVDGDEARRREEAARARTGGHDAVKAPKAPASQASAPLPRKGLPVTDDAARSAQEARARKAFEMKQIQAEVHRQDVARRNRERALKANPGAPLPVPAASAASA